MPNTTNFNFPTPADTDLVKDGALAIRSLGNSIDTTFVDLKGGTTGQVLAKATNTDLDFTWVAQDDSNAIQNAIIDAKGDLIVGTAADTPGVLAVGANDTVLTADSSTATGLKWAAASAGGKNFTLVNAGGTALTGAQTITVSGISNADEIFILISGASSANAESEFRIRFNSDDGSNYYAYGVQYYIGSSYSSTNFRNYGSANTQIILGGMPSVASGVVHGSIRVIGANTSGQKMFQLVGGGNAQGSSEQQHYWTGGRYDSSSTISSVSILSQTGNFDAGTIFVYKSA